MDGTSTPIVPSLDWYAVLASHQHRTWSTPGQPQSRHRTALEPASTSTPSGEAAPIAVGRSDGETGGEAKTRNENNQRREMHAC